MADSTKNLTLLLRAFVDEDEDEACDQLEALREAVAERGIFPNVDRAIARFAAENVIVTDEVERDEDVELIDDERDYVVD